VLPAPSAGNQNIHINNLTRLKNYTQSVRYFKYTHEWARGEALKKMKAGGRDPIGY
jgi:hypothetical protein